LARRLVEKTEAHVLVGLLLLFFLLLSGSSSVTTSGGGSTASGSGSGSTSRADVGQEVLDVLALKSLGEDGSPDGLNFLDLGSSQESLELVGLYVPDQSALHILSSPVCAAPNVQSLDQILHFQLHHRMRQPSISDHSSLSRV
jgi:hypothetical protein